MHVFKLKDRVKWTSSAGGSAKEKRGEVILVVRPHQPVLSLLGQLEREGVYNITALAHSLSSSRGFRAEETYLVAVSGGPRAKKRLYWPRANSLRPHKEKE